MEIETGEKRIYLTPVKKKGALSLGQGREKEHNGNVRKEKKGRQQLGKKEKGFIKMNRTGGSATFREKDATARSTGQGHP